MPTPAESPSTTPPSSPVWIDAERRKATGFVTARARRQMQANRLERFTEMELQEQLLAARTSYLESLMPLRPAYEDSGLEFSNTGDVKSQAEFNLANHPLRRQLGIVEKSLERGLDPRRAKLKRPLTKSLEQYRAFYLQGATHDDGTHGDSDMEQSRRKHTWRKEAFHATGVHATGALDHVNADMRFHSPRRHAFSRASRDTLSGGLEVNDQLSPGAYFDGLIRQKEGDLGWCYVDDTLRPRSAGIDGYSFPKANIEEGARCDFFTVLRGGPAAYAPAPNQYDIGSTFPQRRRVPPGRKRVIQAAPCENCCSSRPSTAPALDDTCTTWKSVDPRPPSSPARPANQKEDFERGMHTRPTTAPDSPRHTALHTPQAPATPRSCGPRHSQRRLLERQSPRHHRAARSDRGAVVMAAGGEEDKGGSDSEERRGIAAVHEMLQSKPMSIERPETAVSKYLRPPVREVKHRLSPRQRHMRSLDSHLRRMATEPGRKKGWAV